MTIGTLYYSPKSARSNWMASYIKYHKLDIDVVNGKELTNYKEIFPLGKVPAFKDSKGRLLTESIAIARYLSILAGELPIDDFEDVSILRWSSFFNQDFREYAIHPLLQKDGIPISEKLEPLMNYFKYLDNHFVESEYLASNRLTYVDLSTCAYFKTIFSQSNGLIDVSSYPHLERWYNVVVEHPVVVLTEV